MRKHLVYFDTERNEIRMVADHCVKSVEQRSTEDGNYVIELGGRCQAETVHAMDACWLEQNSYGHLSLEACETDDSEGKELPEPGDAPATDLDETLEALKQLDIKVKE